VQGLAIWQDNKCLVVIMNCFHNIETSVFEYAIYVFNLVVENFKHDSKFPFRTTDFNFKNRIRVVFCFDSVIIISHC
jgi:hypothetical protein